MGKTFTLTKVKLWVEDDAPKGSGGMYWIKNIAYEFKKDEIDEIWVTEFPDQRSKLISTYGYDSIEDIIFRVSQNLSLDLQDIKLVKCYEDKF